MTEIKDKVVTVESLSTLHEYNTNNYMTNENPTGTGSLSVNRRKDTKIGNHSVTLGYGCTASGTCSVSLGNYTEASGTSSFAHGHNSMASGSYSFAEGFVTKASSESQHVQGRYNIEDTENVYAHIVGNGTGEMERSNAHTLDWDGNAWYAGDIKADGNMILSSNQYGDELPAAGVVGRIFFKRLTDL